VGANHFTLLVLWDDAKTELTGGLSHIRTLAQQYGATIVTIYTSQFVSTT